MTGGKSGLLHTTDGVQRAADARTSPTAVTSGGDALLEVRDLNIYFDVGGAEVQAVRDLSFSIAEGETMGMVGESGSGKSVTALSILRLLSMPPARVEGEIIFDGTNLLELPEAELEHIRGRDISMVFQEPMTALDPVFPVGDQLTETLRAHRSIGRRAAKQQAIEALEQVGIPLPERRINEYPHQLSGGMRQRVMIALALICEPRLLIADEPTTAVDVTIQAQILELLRDLNRTNGTAILLITHDLGVVAEACQTAIALYAGEAVEAGDVDGLLEFPQHPYTSALLSAIPRVETRGHELQSIPGRVPLLGDMPVGCRFRARCDHAEERCEAPQPLQVNGDGQLVRCCRYDELTLQGAVR